MASEENNKSFVIQNLTNQLVELERHFNNLEMNRSSETGRVASNRRAVYSNKTRSRYLTIRPFCYKFHIHLWCVWFDFGGMQNHFPKTPPKPFPQGLLVMVYLVKINSVWKTHYRVCFYKATMK